MESRASYATDTSDAEYAVIEPLIPASKWGSRRGGRPEEYPRREILNGIRYVLRTGCAWRLMPHDLPPWSTTYHYFRRWKNDGTWERIHDQLRGDLREAEGRERQPSAAVIDSQSVKTTEKGGRAVTTRARKSTAGRGTYLSIR